MVCYCVRGTAGEAVSDERLHVFMDHVVALAAVAACAVWYIPACKAPPPPEGFC